MQAVHSRSTEPLTLTTLRREMPQRLAPLREDGQLLQGVPEEGGLLAGRGHLPEGQRLTGHVRHQRGAAVHPEDRGGL